MAEQICPLLKEPCIEHRCHWYTHLLFTNPQTAEPVNKFGCAIQWMPLLQIEQAKEARQAAAATESFRNESVNNARILAAGLVAVADAINPPTDQMRVGRDARLADVQQLALEKKG